MVTPPPVILDIACDIALHTQPDKVEGEITELALLIRDSDRDLHHTFTQITGGAITGKRARNALMAMAIGIHIGHALASLEYDPYPTIDSSALSEEKKRILREVVDEALRLKEEEALSI